jgi:hypothetical protein
MIDTITNKIVEILETVTDIVQVEKFPIHKPEGYPYAFVLYNGDESEVLTNRHDKVTYRFSITLIQEKFEDFKGREAAEATTIDRAFTIAEKFRENNDLGINGVKRVLPLKTTKEYIESGTRIQLTVELLVETIEDVI